MSALEDSKLLLGDVTDEKKKKLELKSITIVQAYSLVFLEELLGLP